MIFFCFELLLICSFFDKLSLHDNIAPMKGVMTGVDVVADVAVTEIGLLVVVEEAMVIVLVIEAMVAVSAVVDWNDPHI